MTVGSVADTSWLGGPEATAQFITSVLEASTQYSIIATDIESTIVLWNEGARQIYGYEPKEVIGTLTLADLCSPEAKRSGLPEEKLRVALADGKWEGTVERVGKSGERFMARVVVTPRRDQAGEIHGFLLISKNISDEIRLTNELRDTQFYTRSLIESNIDALMATDPLGVITDVNKQMEALTGSSRDELIGTRFKNYFTDPERAEAGIKHVVQDGGVTNYELTARHLGGQQTVVSYNASTFRDAHGQLQGVFAAARDITAQKSLEEQLRESEAYNRGLIEASIDGLVTVDADGMISDVNEQMCRLSGTARADLVGTPFADQFADAERAVAGVRQTFEQGVVTDYVLRLAASDGRNLQVSLNASVFHDAGGAVRGIFASARDITEQAHLSRQLADERAYNRGLIEASLDGLITVDNMLVITDVNDTMCTMLGYPRSELIGSEFPTYFTDPRRASDGVRRTLGDGSLTNYELTSRSKDGTERLVSFNAAVFKDTDGSVRRIFASARDITEQAHLSRQLADERAYNRGLIEASVDGLVTVDESLSITDVNDTMCRMVGRQRSDLIGSAFPSYFTEPTLAEDGVRQTFSAGSVRDYVLTLLAADGSHQPVSFNAAVFRDMAGAVRGIFASARDIRSQQKLEQQLRDSQFYTRSLIESNIDALMTTDPLGLITDVNQQMEALTGLERDQLIGTPCKDYFTDPSLAEEGIRSTLSLGSVTNYELTAKHADGHQTVVSYNAATFLNQQDELQGVFAAARDVTDNKRLEEQLREQTGYLRGLIESSADCLVAVAPEGYITDVNEQMCRMSGYQRDDLLGTPFADYFTEPDRARAGVEETLQNGNVTEYALTLISRTRRLLQVSFNASVFTDRSDTVRGIFASARDVTDRVRLEEQLREQQSYLRGLIESSVDGLVTVDPDGFITDVNEQLCRMAEYPRAELIGSAFRQYFTEPTLADRGVKQTFADGIVTNYELVLKARNGRRSRVSFNASVYRAGDRIEGIFASARDISEQARLQQQLSEQQLYNRSLIEASADALFAIAPDGTITDVNEEATQLTGYSRQRLVNSVFSGYFSEPERAHAGVEQTLAEDTVLGYELTLLTRFGRRVTVSFSAGVFRDRAGTALGILAGARDITSQKQLEQQLRDSQFYTRSLIESNVDALMTTDPIGVITDVNRQMEELTGVDRDGLIGTAFRQYFTEPDLAEDGIRTVLREGTVTDYELVARHHDGRETVVSYNAACLYDRDRKLQGVFAAARDVTERKRFEQQLWEKNVELEKASQAKDNFLASMSHELRTPLNAIIGFTGTLLMELPGPLNEEQIDQLDTVQNSGKHLLSIINDLLDLAKIESGKVQIALEPVNCTEVIEEVVQSLRPLAEEKGLELAADLPTAPVVARSDRRALGQILINLVNNAIKFTDAGTVRVAIPTRTDDQRVLISVTDTGRGIDEPDTQHIFEAFARSDDAARSGAEGTGLGLHICQKLSELIHARISLTSSPGKGSTFTLTMDG